MDKILMFAVFKHYMIIFQIRNDVVPKSLFFYFSFTYKYKYDYFSILFLCCKSIKKLQRECSEKFEKIDGKVPAKGPNTKTIREATSKEEPGKKR